MHSQHSTGKYKPATTDVLFGWLEEDIVVVFLLLFGCSEDDIVVFCKQQIVWVWERLSVLRGFKEDGEEDENWVNPSATIYR
jgi:hypothetical protein